MFRRPGVLLPLERRILEVAVARGSEGVYGFALAKELAGPSGDRRLVAHGTLYKALDRLRKAGLLTAAWEEAEEAEGRPRRRLYTVTADGARALAGADEPGAANWGEAPA